jgi:hypothetical protein
MSGQAKAPEANGAVPSLSTTSTKKSKKANKNQPAKLPELSAKRSTESQSETFANYLMQKSIASIALSSGFGISEGGALHGLTTLAKQKIQSLGLELKRTAEASRRKLVTIEDFAVCVPSVKEVLKAPQEPLRQITGVPPFPYDPSTRKLDIHVQDSNTGEQLKRISGLGTHFPPLPAEHTYKKSKLEIPEPSTAEIAELRRTQQKQSVLVRESLAKMREGGQTGSLAPPM